MSISLQADATLPQGYIKINGTTAATVTASGITAPITGNVTGNVTGNLTGNVTGVLSSGGSLTLGTAQATTSGTAIDFTGIPSWAKRITVLFNGVSLSGTANFLLQIGAGSLSTSGYVSASGLAYGNNQTVWASSTSGFVILDGAAVNVFTGTLTICLVSSTTWVGSIAGTIATGGLSGGGTSPTLAGSLDRIRITTSNGTDTFDAGSVNIMYEG